MIYLSKVWFPLAPLRRGASRETRAFAVRIRAMLELCVLPPHSDVALAPLLSWECTEDALMAQLAARDPTGWGWRMQVGLGFFGY